MVGHDQADLVIGVTPFARPDPAVVVGLARAGALGVLDLGADPAVAHTALDEVVRWTDASFGVRVGGGLELDPAALPGRVGTVILDDPASVLRWSAPGRRVLVEVRDPAVAREAIWAGADGLVAKGSESGGRIGDLTTFVLLQHLVEAHERPIWALGGIGLHTAAAAVAGGATGVVLDAQLALVRESTLGRPAKAAVAAMDGSETVVVGEHRVFTRPDLPAPADATGRSPAEVADLLGADDLHTRLLPVGQDGAFAAPLAKRFGTAGGVARAVREAILDHIGSASVEPPLAPRNPLCRQLGTAYPIAQGPMTRVSDRAEF
ncbi:MAG: nitronate monooxygenase, partial [Actinomycetota bacterium]